MGEPRVRSRWFRGVLVAAAIAVGGVMPVAAHGHITVGGDAVVSNTNGDGVNFRDVAGLDSSVMSTLSEGTSVSVIGGPQALDNGSTWYNVDAAGAQGWIIGDYLDVPVTNENHSVTVVDTDGHGLRLRADASTSAGTLTVIPEGTTVDVVGDEVVDVDGIAWVNVSYDGLNGYSAKSYLAVAGGGAATIEQVAVDPEPEQPEPLPDVSGVAVGGNAEVVNTGGSGLNVRHNAGYGAGVVTVAAEGDVMSVIDGPSVDAEGANWWGVDYRGHSGWVHGDYVAGTDRAATDAPSSTPSEVSASGSVDDTAPVATGTGQAIANTAMQYLGHPYVWGGTTPSGFDCSGFLFYVVNEVAGGDFPRLLDSMVTRGTYVSPENLQPGDLVFQENTYKWGLSHAGIYIGNDQFINAASPGAGVVVSNLWDSYWGPRYYTARRIS